MALSARLERFILHSLSSRAPGVLDSRLSLLYYDDHGPPNDRLLDLSSQAIQHARREDLSAISSRMAAGPRWPDLWPGEHYKLLAGLVRALQPASVVEIGTYQGLSALALAKHLPAGGKLHSYDLVPWNQIRGQTLRAGDLEGGRITPIIADLTRRDAFEENRPVLESAQLLFVDAAKDGRMERIFLDRFESLEFRVPPIIVLDDIRLWNMLAIWRGVSRPKLDLTSFGHWSGTGLIDWQSSRSTTQR